MLILALDTTARGGSCAVARDAVVLREEAGDASRSHAERLPGELMDALAHACMTRGDIELFAVATGPGSFTGLRVGIATMQGLAFAAGKPLIGISALDALAALAAGSLDAGADVRRAARVATLVDAWRGEVYAALYEHGAEIEPPVVAPLASVLARWGGRDTLFIGDGAARYAELVTQTPGARMADPAAPALAGTIARLATIAAAAGAAAAPHAIRPLYVRRPDAELARDARPVR